MPICIKNHDSGLIPVYLGNHFPSERSSAPLLIQNNMIHLTIHTRTYANRNTDTGLILGMTTSSSEACWFPALLLQIPFKQVLLQKLTFCTNKIPRGRWWVIQRTCLAYCVHSILNAFFSTDWAMKQMLKY